MNAVEHAEVIDFLGNRDLPQGGHFAVGDRDSALRQELESAIRRGFDAHFGACIEGFMPALASFELRGAKAIIGYRPASAEPLYLESYLDEPIDILLGNITSEPVSRSDIVEVGQLVVQDRRIVGPLFRALVPYLLGQGYQWICFTGTHKIRRLLAHTGFAGLTVAYAAESAVSGSGDRWGSYYSNDPQVIVGKLSDPQGGWCSEIRGFPPRAVALGA